jgi:hypothetical protein
MSMWRDPWDMARESPPHLGNGSYWGIDERYKRRKKKQPVGFVPPTPKPTPRKKK